MTFFSGGLFWSVGELAPDSFQTAFHMFRTAVTYQMEKSTINKQRKHVNIIIDLSI